jgi:hypothetical protein
MGGGGGAITPGQQRKIRIERDSERNEDAGYRKREIKIKKIGKRKK